MEDIYSLSIHDIVLMYGTRKPNFTVSVIEHTYYNILHLEGLNILPENCTGPVHSAWEGAADQRKILKALLCNLIAFFRIIQ